MIFLLLTLLAFAVIVTMIGFFLTTKSPVRDQAPEYLVARSSRRVVDSSPWRGERMLEPVSSRGRRVVDSMPVSQRRVVESLPVRSGRFSTGNGIPDARYLPTSAIWGRINVRQKGEPLPWSIITIGLISIFILGLYTFNFVLPHHPLISLLMFNQNASGNSQKPQPVYQASQNLVRISQLDPAQYNSQQEYNLWAYSACSSAAITEVINAYGHHYRVTDILKVEAQIGEITPQQGLLEDIGIQRTATQFGFKTTWGHNLSLDQIMDIANHGKPVIVSFPPDRYAGGHIVDVTGGNSNYVYLADSSRLNHQSFTRQRFMQLWGGFSAILTPN
jgi:Peptidase_C39 like family